MQARGRARLVTSAAVAALVTLTGCQSTDTRAGDAAPSASTKSPSSSTTTPAAAVARATIAVTPADGATKVRPDTAVFVRASGGTLGEVRVLDQRGKALSGALSPDKTSWTSSGPLAVRATYTVKATAANTDGKASRVSTTLATVRPKDSADYDVGPFGTVGVGMPVVVQFAGSVRKSRQDDIERRMKITTTPAVKGSWGWLDARQLLWRPAHYWTPGTKVSVKADLAGIETRPGIWTVRNGGTSFRVGSAMVSTVNVKAHTLTVRRGGAVLRTIPITTGKPGHETRGGTKVILTHESSRQMDAETTGLAKSDPDYYNIKVRYAMRLTWSGEFLHAAPWSVGSQGRANVSHGCTGMSTANAQWLFNQSKIGDVVTYTGARRSLEPYNGYTMWNMSLAQWAKRSAVAA